MRVCDIVSYISFVKNGGILGEESESICQASFIPLCKILHKRASVTEWEHLFETRNT